MAREDLILNLLAQLHDKKAKDPPSKNEVLQKIQMVNDWFQIEDTGLVTVTVSNPMTFRWGGTGVTAGWVWGAGQWR